MIVNNHSLRLIELQRPESYVCVCVSKVVIGSEKTPSLYIVWKYH